MHSSLAHLTSYRSQEPDEAVDLISLAAAVVKEC